MSSFGHFEAIIDTIADPIFVKDRCHRWVLLNDACCRFIGFAREELIGKSDYDFCPKPEADVFWAKDEIVFESGIENVNDEDFTDSNGVTHSITTKKSLYISPSGAKFIVGCIRDVTELMHARQELQRERDRLEAAVAERTAELVTTNEALREQIAENQRTADQLRQSQKMEAIGRLAGGVAHDFNNLLNIILGYSALLEQQLDGNPKLRESARQIATAAEEGAALTRQLLAFSRKQVLHPELVNVDDVLRTTHAMLSSMVGEEIELLVSPGAQSANVRVGRGQIEQLIINLVANARDAMREGGKLTISTGNLDSSDDTDDREPGLLPGRYVVMTITDTGEGMDAETQQHMFEPFFTTKDVGKGTGLGLAMVFGIVRQSGGCIRVHSSPAQGTTVKVCLPCVSGPAPATRAEEIRPTSLQGCETILLVEDQHDLRGLLLEVLRAKGYTVLEANTGYAAIDIAERHSGSLDLLITDIVMPGMRGWEVARRITASRPHTKVLYVSGHTDTDLRVEGALSCREILLEKPFKPEALLMKVRDVLAADNRHAGERVS